MAKPQIILDVEEVKQGLADKENLSDAIAHKAEEATDAHNISNITGLQTEINKIGNAVKIQNIEVADLTAIEEGQTIVYDGVQFIGGFAPPPPPPTYDANHVAVWKLDETSGTTVSDSVGSFTGTAGTGATIVDGWEGKARQFDGTVNAKITFTSKIIPMGAKTIRFKIKKTGTPATETIFSNIAGANERGLWVYFLSTALVFRMFNGSGTEMFRCESTYLPTDGNYHDIQMVWDGTTNANGAKLYIKALEGANAGKWVDSAGNWVDTITPHKQATSSTTETSTPTRDLWIGQRQDNIQSLTGTLDEIEISDIARTDMLDYE